jgi:putative hemolysin
MLPGTLAIVTTTLFVSFLCSLMEATVLSLSKAEVSAIALHDARLGAIWTDFKQRIHGPLAAILIVNTAAMTIGTALAAERFAALYGERGVLISSIVITFLMVQWAELLPKTLGSRHRRAVAALLGRPLHVAVLALSPLVALVRALNRPFERSAIEPPTSIEEIRALAHDAQAANVIGAQDDAIIGRAAGLTKVPAHKIMVPREEMSVLSTTMTLEEALIHAHLEAHTRFPLCESGDLDLVVGYVNLKEVVAILHTNPGAPTLRGITRPIHRVADSANVSSVLRDFVDQHLHVALVTDTGGRTVGMITMEDLVEELMGELAPEFEPLPRRIHELGGDLLMVGGGVNLADVLRRAGVPGQLDGTLASWVASQLSRVPRPGDELDLHGARVVVRRIRRGRVFDATIARSVPAAAPTPHTS